MNKMIITILSFFIISDALLIYLTLTISPIKLKRNSFTYEYGETISTNVSDYVNANPKILESVTLDLSHVSSLVGNYQASIEYMGQKQTFEINIVDSIRPKVELKQVQFIIEEGDTIKAKDLIKKIEDKSATTVYFLDEITQQKMRSKTYNKQGSYIEKIIVEDDHGNQSASLRVKIVVDINHVLPIISGADDITIQIGEDIDLSKGIKATDDKEGDITQRIKIEGHVDNQNEGEYLIVYTVSDKVGNMAKVVRKVTVKDDN